MSKIVAQVFSSNVDYLEVSNVAELDTELDRLAELNRGKPVIVEIINEKGDSLSIGLGGNESLLHLVSSNGPYWVSTGNARAKGTAVFYLDGQWTEIRRKQLVPIAEAREAVRHWYLTGSLSPALRWTDRP